MQQATLLRMVQAEDRAFKSWMKKLQDLSE